MIPSHFLPQCQAMIYLAASVFHNIMACRVFRLLRLVDRTDNSTFRTDLALSEMNFGHITQDAEAV